MIRKSRSYSFVLYLLGPQFVASCIYVLGKTRSKFNLGASLPRLVLQSSKGQWRERETRLLDTKSNDFMGNGEVENLLFV